MQPTCRIKKVITIADKVGNKYIERQSSCPQGRTERKHTPEPSEVFSPIFGHLGAGLCIVLLNAFNAGGIPLNAFNALTFLAPTQRGPWGPPQAESFRSSWRRIRPFYEVYNKSLTQTSVTF